MILRVFVRHASTVAKKTPRTVGRYEIVSQSLCNDVLDRLRPSLPAPNTCDLIDINPGTGLWSKKLHRTLQPRRHVLVEPNLKRYEDYLGPLLEHRGSRYRHVTNLEEAFSPEKELLSKYDTAKGGADGEVRQFNHELLMTVNLSNQKITHGGYMGTLGKKFFDDLFFALFSDKAGHGLFRYGLIRILAWIPEEKEVEPFIPRTVYRRFKQTITLEAMSDVTEIAGLPGGHGTTRYTRWPGLEQEEYAALNTKVEQGLAYRAPDSRLDQPPAADLRSIKPTMQNLQGTRVSTDGVWLSNFLKLTDRLKREDPTFYREHADGSRARGLGSRVKTPLQREWLKNDTIALTRYKGHMKAVTIVNEGRQLFVDWRTAVQNAGGEPLDPDLEQQFRLRGDENHKKLQALAVTYRVWARKALDDCRAVEMSPPILFWSRRDTHPLVVKSGEFEPSNRHMALLDVVPNANLLLKLDSLDKMICFRHVMATFTQALSYTVPEALKMLVHDTGVEEFVKTIKGIHDSAKGGWYDLTQLRLRALPSDLFVEIALAYERWPFRPSIHTMLLSSPDSQATFHAEVERIK
ncbi:hypothetical protein H2200_011836 [Cladophialophora chaetospira]|uniref:rRNA adenine N(6)-methyltransferase n=1 Tax=Cladophialophora chaetospira TaxID=386627 RepID=A0AA39CCW6_9EURO|nr:hypothetical protein H2200_011836 [Cladophialophora chaetospira]